VALGLVPFLRPHAFLASGTQSRNSWWQPLVFRVLSLALLVGIPFFLVFAFAKHNIAAHLALTDGARKPDKDADDSVTRTNLHETDLYEKRWESFWKRAKNES